MAKLDDYLEELVIKCGGMSKFQFILLLITMLSKVGPTWSMLAMTFAGFEPDWECRYEDQGLYTNGTNDNITLKTCSPPSGSNESMCTKFVFMGDKQTVVNEVRTYLTKTRHNYSLSRINIYF